MEMNQVAYFLALCEEQNFTRAARHCGVSQPSLTRAIQQLERELGAPLFVRGKPRSPLAPLGKIVRPHFAVIDRSAQKIAGAAAQFTRATRGELRIGRRGQAAASYLSGKQPRGSDAGRPARATPGSASTA